MEVETLNGLHNEKDECLPMKSLDELKIWKPDYSVKHSTHPLQKRACIKDCPQTLVCHDMKGGYLEDRFLNGSETEDNYYFIHWSVVDIFVYFSHNLVTIPPCGWITAAHRNGVKVLGTFITENDAGKEICDATLCDVESVHQICLQLVSIANFYQFDGWLINIENKLEVNQISLLEEFVRFLTQKMHESQPDSLVIWYDSVIESGELKWQNELNEHNKAFFHACDGIYLNYNWTKDTLTKSVKEAGSRKSDVFVGVDVFGRGCLGGGGFSTDIAVTAARDFNLSVAIFAPGWVHECLDKKDFLENQYKFWLSLSELCAPRVIESLPYYSSFCPGFGKKMFRDRKIIKDKPWYNLNLQQPQPSYHYTDSSSDGGTVSICSSDAFNGGGCLQLKSKRFRESNSVEFRILNTNFLINTGCSISYTYKALVERIQVDLILSVSVGKKLYKVYLSDKFLDECDETSTPLLLNCLTSDKCKLQPVSTISLCNENKDAEVPDDFDDESECTIISDSGRRSRYNKQPPAWHKRNYKVYCYANESFVIKNVCLEVSWAPEDCYWSNYVFVRLGELSIFPIEPKFLLSYKDLTVEPEDKSYLTVSCLLEWTPDASINYSDLYLSVGGYKNCIGTTSQFFYRFKDSIKETHHIEFILRPNCFGKYSEPIFLKVPLSCNKSFSDQKME